MYLVLLPTGQLSDGSTAIGDLQFQNHLLELELAFSKLIMNGSQSLNDFNSIVDNIISITE